MKFETSHLLTEVVRAQDLQNLITNYSIPPHGKPENYFFYKNSIHLIARRNKSLEGIWSAPLIDMKDGKKAAKRPWRLMPYAGPLLFNKKSLSRRAALKALFLELKKHVEYISLPLSPDILEASILQNLGALIEWRHTHVLDKYWADRNLDPKIANHLRYTSSRLQIIKSIQPGGFLFDQAISGEHISGLHNRKEFGNYLIHNQKAYYLSAFHNEKLVGQSFIVTDTEIDYVFHTWVDKKSMRGISTALIAAAALNANKQSKGLDLEGSVIPGVDGFFHGFQGNIIPYGFLLWSYDNRFLSPDLLREIMPEERYLSNEGAEL
jgi:hypothetical protein